MKIKNVTALILLLSVLLARGNILYVTQSGNLPNTNSLAGLNAWTNVSAGDTIHLVGTLTNTLTIGGSGTLASPITLLFESGAKIQAPTWSGATGPINLNSQSNLVIDGNNTGLLACTANGSGLAYSNNVYGIYGDGFNVSIQNLTITNIFVCLAGDEIRVGYPLAISGAGIVVSNCNLSDGDAVIAYTGPSAGTYSNVSIIGNRIQNFNHGIFIGLANVAAPGNTMVRNFIIASNYLDHTEGWNDTGGSHHLDYIIMSSSTYDPSICFNGLYIYNNTFGPHFGPQNTAGIYNGISNPQDQTRNVFIFNNLFQAVSNSWGNGFVSMGGGSNVWVFNNTCVGPGSMTIGSTNAYCYNNLVPSGLNLVAGTRATEATVSSTVNATNNLYILTNFFSGVWSDHNVFTNPASSFGLQLYTTTNAHTLWIIGGGFSFATWSTYNNNEYGTGGSLDCGCGWTVPNWNMIHADPHSTNLMPVFQTGTYIPATNDIATVGGTNLYFLAAQSVSNANFDFNGNARLATGNWTIGAFGVGRGGTGQSAQVMPPFQLQVVPHGQ